MNTTHEISPRFTARAGAALAKTLSAAAVAGFLLTGCATVQNESSADTADRDSVNDPIEAANRIVFQFNRLLDAWFLKPAAIFYKDVLPPPIAESIGNFVNNLSAPVILANDLLQGDLDRAGTTTMRFIINTTAGVAGLRDPAADWGYKYHDEDFGQTLAVWGVGEGPYIMLPVFGPSNPRDAIGLVVDALLNPINHWASNTDQNEVVYAAWGLRAIDQRAASFDAIQDLEKTSLDFYATVRSLYRQTRAKDIRNGAPSGKLGFDKAETETFDFSMSAPGDDDDGEISQAD